MFMASAAEHTDFNPRSPCGERPLRLTYDIILPRYFNPRSPCGERPEAPGKQGQLRNFNPRSPCGERPNTTSTGFISFIFQSTLPVWGATNTWSLGRSTLVFQSTLPVWGATEMIFSSSFCILISIHAPRVGSDRAYQHCPVPGRHFNPRSPCGERRYECPVPVCSAAISIHAPRVGSDYFRISGDLGRPISIHAPRVGSDFVTVSKLLPILRFQSTLPVWGATHQGHVRSDRKTISIHAPRVGSDSEPTISESWLFISIHAPRVGSDPMRSPHFSHPCLFQSTLPVWGATSFSDPTCIWGSDFNPRSPCGERPTL